MDDSLFLLFWKHVFRNLCFGLPSNIYTCQSYIYELSHELFFLLFLETLFWKHFFGNTFLETHSHEVRAALGGTDDKLADEIISQFDEDGDGMISYEEFENMMLSDARQTLLIAADKK